MKDNNMSLVQKEAYLKYSKNPGIPTKKYPSLELVRLEKIFFKNDTANKNLLEYGIGDGPNTEHLLRQGYTIHGIDISEGALKSTEKRLENDIDLIKNLKLTKLPIDAQKLDFEDNTFDYIVALSVLSLLGDINRINCLLSEFKRITKIGGKLILDINDHDSEFSAGKKQIDENVFLLDPNEENMKCYCLKNEEAFKSMLEKFFEIKDIGFSAHKIFGKRIHEWIACVVNK